MSLLCHIGCLLCPQLDNLQWPWQALPGDQQSWRKGPWWPGIVITITGLAALSPGSRNEGLKICPMELFFLSQLHATLCPGSSVKALWFHTSFRLPTRMCTHTCAHTQHGPFPQASSPLLYLWRITVLKASLWIIHLIFTAALWGGFSY